MRGAGQGRAAGEIPRPVGSKAFEIRIGAEDLEQNRRQRPFIGEIARRDANLAQTGRSALGLSSSPSSTEAPRSAHAVSDQRNV
ncbi:MAG TPA: hypothetical protein VFN87_17340 [Solirubrobacteraceae bacterium]|nr:hypothetical protein [Solirubrobacteraceae bacterium]